MELSWKTSAEEKLPIHCSIKILALLTYISINYGSKIQISLIVILNSQKVMVKDKWLCNYFLAIEIRKML